MSRIGLKPISVPQDITVTITDNIITAKGPRGELSQSLPSGIVVIQKDKQLLVNRTNEQRQTVVVKNLQEELKLTNQLQVPAVEKVVINVGVTEEQHQDKALENMRQQLAVITGQMPKTTTAKKSIAGFKLRAGDPIGLMVTLRGQRMYQFLDKLISIVLPRVKDFQGVKSTAFDQNGNYSLGLEEQIVFPEIDYDKIDKVRSLQINIVTNTRDTKVAQTLLSHLGIPFTKKN